MRKPLLVLFLVVLLGVVAACGGDDDDAATEPAATGEAVDTAATTEEEADPCAKEELETVVDGSLSIGADNPSFPPWFEDAEGAPWDPTGPPTDQGYEAAVTAAVVEQLGFTPDEVRWVVVPFNNSYKPGPKDFDFYVNQVSFTPKRDEAVDFSDSYYDVEQAVVTLKDSEFANATTLAELKGAKLSAQLGTTSYDAIVNVVQPDQDPAVFDKNIEAITALKNGQIDGIVVDFPTSLYVTAVQVPKGKIVGRLPAGEEYLGYVFEEGNPLRDCVNEAIAALQADGTITQLQDEWINASAPPVLE
jgi:polar amino acid transport system substrate-binding protein